MRFVVGLVALWFAAVSRAADPAALKFGPVAIDELRKWEGFAAAPVVDPKVPVLSADEAARWERLLREGLVDHIGEVSSVKRDPADPEHFNWFAGAAGNRNVATWAVEGKRGGALVILNAEGGLRIGLRLNPGVRGPADERDLPGFTRRVLRDLWKGEPPAEPSRAKDAWLRWDGPDGFHNIPEAVVHAWVQRPNDAKTPTRISIETGTSFESWKTLTDAAFVKQGRMSKRTAIAETVAYVDARAGTKPGADFGPNVPADTSGLLIHEAWAERFAWSVTVSLPGWTSTLGMVDATRKLSSYGTGSGRTAAEGWRVWEDLSADEVRKWDEYKAAVARMAEQRKAFAAAWARAKPKVGPALKALLPAAAEIADAFEPFASFFDGSRLVSGANQDGLQRQHRIVFQFVAGVPQVQYMVLSKFPSAGEPDLDNQAAWLVRAEKAVEALFGSKPTGELVVESHKIIRPQPKNIPNEQRAGPPPPFYRFHWSPVVNGLRLPHEFGVTFSVQSEGPGLISLSCNRGIHADDSAAEVKALAAVKPAIDGRTAAASTIKSVARLFPREPLRGTVTAEPGLMSSDEWANIKLWSTFADANVPAPGRKLILVWRVTTEGVGGSPSFQAVFDAATGRPLQVNRMAREVPSRGG